MDFKSMLDPAEQGDLLSKESQHTTVQFSNNRLKKINSGESSREILRLIKNGRVGLVENTKPENKNRLIEMAREASELGSRVEFSLPGPVRLENPEICDEQIDKLKLEELIQPAQEFIQKTTSYHPDLQAEVSIRKENNYIKLENSSGFSGAYKQTQVKILFGLRLIEGKNLLVAYSFPQKTHWENINWEEEREILLQKIDWGRKNVSLTSGNYPVLFIPETFAEILHPVEACLNGQAIVRGLSPWENRLGEKIFSDNLNLSNDGLLQRGPESKPFDREGVACSSFPLFENGKLKNYLLDLDTAHKLNLTPMGTGGENGPVVNNLVMDPGERSFSEMLSSIDEGILIAGTMGAWAGNPYGGQVSGNISLGYKIRNGKIEGRLKDAMFSLNIFRAFKDNISAIGSEPKWVDNLHLPPVLIDPVNISIKG